MALLLCSAIVCTFFSGMKGPSGVPGSTGPEGDPGLVGPPGKNYSRSYLYLVLKHTEELKSWHSVFELNF